MQNFLTLGNSAFLQIKAKSGKLFVLVENIWEPNASETVPKNTSQGKKIINEWGDRKSMRKLMGGINRGQSK